MKFPERFSETWWRLAQAEIAALLTAVALFIAISRQAWLASVFCEVFDIFLAGFVASILWPDE